MKLLHKRSKYRWMLDDVSFRSWIENVERGSLITGHEMYRRIGYICSKFGTTPAKLAKMKSKDATAFALKVISYCESAKYLGNNTRLYVAALKAWWTFNGTGPSAKIRIAGAGEYLKYENETVPTQAELWKIINAADVRGKVLVSLSAFAGLRPGVLGDFLGNDGLKVKDISDMILADNKVEFQNIPAEIIVRKNLSKACHQYSSLIPEQACRYIKQYLEHRIRSGERLTPESPVITAQGANKWKFGHHIRTINIGDTIRKPISTYFHNKKIGL